MRHAHEDGHYATPKVFATPVSLPSSAPGSRPTSAAMKRPGSANRPLFGAAGSGQKHKIGNSSSFKRPSSSSSLPRKHSPTPSGYDDQAVLHGHALHEQSNDNGQQQHRVSPRQWEHWAVGSPGRAAAEAAHAREQTYNTPRTGSAFSSYSMPRPSIPPSHAVMMSSGAVVRGRAFFGEAAMRPSSATSARSHGSAGSGRGGGGSPSRGSSGLAFPSRKAITAELSALRHKFGAAASESSSSNHPHHQYHNQRPHSSPSSRRNRNSAEKMKDKLDAMVYRINNQVNVHDMGSGSGEHHEDHHYEDGDEQGQGHYSGRIPRDLMPDALDRRKQETNRVMRREEKVEREQDKRIRNFKARALVHSATQMAQQKAGEELKEIKEKIVWAKTRRDAVESELFDLREKLASLPGGR